MGLRPDLFSFQNSDIVDGDEELPEWRHSWIAGIALLRAIGHVLSKVDAEKSQKHQAAIDRWWNESKSDRASSEIFWEFVEKERNTLLKTYSFGARLSQDENGYYVEFEDGYDAFEMFRQAVYWWREQLISVESTAS